MIINDLRERDAQTYRFRFYTDGGKHTGQPGVTLTVTDLKVTVSDTESGGKNLTCSSTCTLPKYHTYIWYKTTGSAVTVVGNSSSLTLTAGEVGRFYCKAENALGSYNSSEWSFPSSDYSTVIYAASGVAVVLLLVLMVFLLMRRRATASSSKSEENRGTQASAPVYETVSDLALTSAPTMTAASDDQDEVQYSNVHFNWPHTQEGPLYSPVQQPSTLKREEEVEYSTVKLVKT
ncbi:uncharacterized protein [Salminus brasiliensis]|uniref:uncharacterized protein n=1 Tax=Salminus brasiliensis TaxID=930266 RepID=UPI003B8331FB